MCEHEYTALIPAHELRQVRALLRTVHARRGWATELAHQDAAWADVLAAARTQEGGGWPDDLTAAQLLPARLAALSMAIDRLLLGGQLQQWLLDWGAAPLGFAVVQEAPGPDDWISYFDERANRVVLRQQRWEPAALAVTEERPMSCEGVLCTSNLQVLAHTLAHEMVHALVFHHFPAMDASSEAYLPDERHGPIFKLLNKRLFGHAIDSFRPVFRAPPPAGAGAAGAAADCT